MSYVPDSRDIVWLEFDPQTGTEQKGHRPALVMTSKEFNLKTKLMMCCPITSKIKGNPFEVVLPKDTLKEPSAVLVIHFKSVDWQSRNARYETVLRYKEYSEVQDKLAAILELE